MERTRSLFTPDTWSLFAAATALHFAGVLARLLASPESMGLAFSLGIYLLPPLLLVVGFCAQHPQKSVRWGAALAAGALAGWYMFGVSEPSINRDANFGIGFYLMFGVFPLFLAALLGGLAGHILDRVRGVRPSDPAEAVAETRAPRPPLKPWLWPALLLLPAALLAGWLEWADMQATLQEMNVSAGLISPWEQVPMFAFFKLMMLAPVALLPLLGLLAAQGRPRAALAAWWGVCTGLVLSLILAQLGPAVGTLELEMALQFLPAAILGALGWWWGSRSARF